MALRFSEAQNIISVLKMFVVYVRILYKFRDRIAYLKFPNTKHGLILNETVLFQ